ncbi:MAG: acyltransferase family protein [Deltaproteobacteria bacterium]|nr:acyltransferase family protein [Deltaproteobacteria bacterium]
MLTRSGPPPTAGATADAATTERAPARRALGLLAASIYPSVGDHPTLTFVAELDESAIARVRRESLALRLRHRVPVTVELRYVADATAAALVATLGDLGSHEVAVLTRPVGGVDAPVAPPPSPRAAAPPLDAGPDPFGIDPAFRARALPVLRFMFERYWRTEVSGLERLPAGRALVVANHSGAVPADAFMMATALELRAERRLRVLYDKFVDALPLVGGVYRRLGGVTASLANAERLLRRGELVGLFPEGIAGVEKHCTERYRLRPFRTGAARLSIRTASPVVPVAIVGAEEAYPVVARLYRAGRLVGIPWIPVTPTFPLCGVAGALPLPTKWTMHFGTPIAPPPPDGRSEDDRVAELTGRVRDAVAEGVRALLAKRSGIFL